MTLLEAIGWLGSAFFAISALPQAFHTWKEGKADGLAWSFLLMWLAGELLCLTYVSVRRDWPLIANYIMNLACLLVMLRYKLRPLESSAATQRRTYKAYTVVCQHMRAIVASTHITTVPSILRRPVKTTTPANQVDTVTMP